MVISVRQHLEVVVPLAQQHDLLLHAVKVGLTTAHRCHLLRADQLLHLRMVSLQSLNQFSEHSLVLLQDHLRRVLRGERESDGDENGNMIGLGLNWLGLFIYHISNTKSIHRALH